LEVIKMVGIETGLIAISAAIAVGVSAVSTAIAEKEIGTAAIGAMAEDEKLFGKGLILTVIPESILILGFVIAFMLWLKIP
jgi:V/A-type H+-transporting ATPase subunit K